MTTVGAQSWHKFQDHIAICRNSSWCQSSRRTMRARWVQQSTRRSRCEFDGSEDCWRHFGWVFWGWFDRDIVGQAGCLYTERPSVSERVLQYVSELVTKFFRLWRRCTSHSLPRIAIVCSSSWLIKLFFEIEHSVCVISQFVRSVQKLYMCICTDSERREQISADLKVRRNYFSYKL